MVKAFNAQEKTPFTIRFGVPTDFEQVVSRRADHPVIGGELNPVFQGVYSTRIELKQSMREDERILGSADALSALAETFGTPSDKEKRWQAWEPVLFNEAHDLSSGTMVDKVYLDTIRTYELARDMGSAIVQGSTEAIASQIDTENKDKSATPVLIVNTLGWSRTDVAQTEVRFPSAGVKAIEVQGPDGVTEPSQIVQADRDAAGDIHDATIAFLPHDVPAMGWKIYYILPLNEQAARNLPEGRNGSSPRLLHSDPYQPGMALSDSTTHVDSGSIENEFYRATFDLWSGAMTSLELKSTAGGWQVLGNRPGNIVACEQDGGDSWELYGNLNGARFTAMTRPSGLPQPDRSHLSNEWVGGSGRISAGPVFRSSISITRWETTGFQPGCASIPAYGVLISRLRSPTTTNLFAIVFSFQPLFRTGVASMRFRLEPSQDRSSMNFPRRSGSIGAMANTAWPYSISACQAVTWRMALCCFL